MKKKFFKIQSKTYGKKLVGTKIYYSGFKQKPKFIKDDGSFSLGKHTLEILGARFKKFTLTLVATGKSKILKKGQVYHVNLTVSDYNAFQMIKRARSRGLNLKIVNNQLVELFPKYFTEANRFFSYEKGMFKEIFDDRFSPTQLSKQDAEAINKFLPRFLSYKTGDDANVSSIISKKRSYQLLYLEKFVTDLEKRIKKVSDESTWQKYFKENILILQEGYIKKIEKLNIDIDQRFPDFCLVSSDGYLDVFEIKTPKTALIKLDKSHKNYYWSADISKAIAQAEKYIDVINKNSDRLRTYVKDKHNIDLRIIKPRGIIIAGNNEQLDKKDQQDDFRLLNDSLKNITVITYSDMAQRVRNIIYTFREFENKKAGRGKRSKKT